MTSVLAVAILASGQQKLDPEIAKSYRLVQKATLAKDVAQMRSLWKQYVDPSCTAQVEGQKLSSARLLALMEQQMSQIQKVSKCEITVLKFGKAKDTLVCTVKTSQASVFLINKKPVKFDGVTVAEDTWKKVGGKYKIVNIKVLSESRKTGSGK
ncbi:MAG TPA: hypothetical protein VK171_10215 [Fimbriimonas sp.]|nr:hypothetical protein [Fimbriimonas sp.]